MKTDEIREMTDDELRRSIGEHRQELFDLRLQAQTGQLEDTARIRRARRDLARVLTEQTVRSHEPRRQGVEA